MAETFVELPGWSFEVDETSANVFKVIGRDESGRSVERTGFDPDKLLEEAKRDALEIVGKSNG